MTTLIQLVSDVQDGSGRQIGSSATQVKRLVNDAYQEVARSGRLTLVSLDISSDLTPGTGDYGIVADLEIEDLQSIKYLVTAGSGPETYAQPTSLGDILNLRSAATIDSQQPYLYSLNGDTLSLYPSPGTGDTAVLWYYARPAVLVDDTDAVDESIVPPEFHDLIVLRALARSARNLDKGSNNMGAQTSRMYQVDYLAGLAELKRWRNRRDGSVNQVVQIGPNRRPRFANDIYYSGDNV